MSSGYLLPLLYDPVRLRADLAKVGAGEWSPHYNDGDYGGEWRGASLRSASGSVGDLAAQPAPGCTFKETPLLGRCPYFREVLASFPCRLKSARLLALAPGSFIREHCDPELEYAAGEVRLHVPIETGPEVEFYVKGQRLLLEEGRCYYINVHLPHRVKNGGGTERTHLVIDAEVNEWLHDLFRRARLEGWEIPRCTARRRGFEEFRERVVGSPELCERLHAAADRRALAERAAALGRELGYQFSEGEVAPSAACAAADSDASLAGWTPVKVSFRSSQAMAEWIYTGQRRFQEPFFQDSVRMAKRNPFTAIFRREAPLEAADRIAALTPTGFIFHMSRCGSTLLAQMLAALDRAVVISEAPPIDDVLQAGLNVPELAQSQRVRWLRRIVAALGQRRSGEESLFFLKLDAWHIHDLPLIREAFPGVPWIFVHRRLEEVIASQLRQPGLPALPGALDPRVVRLRPEDATALSREQWCERVLEGFLDAAGKFRGSPDGLFIEYGQLPDALWSGIASHFGVRFSGQEISRMKEAARFDSKNPACLFSQRIA